MPDWIAPIGVPAVFLAIIAGSIWVGRIMERMSNLRETVDKDREDFRELLRADRASAAEDRKRFWKILDEIREDIKKIFRRLPPIEIVGVSPLRLTDLGQAISEDVKGYVWADKTAPSLKDTVNGLEAFEIQELCFEYTSKPNSFDEAMKKLIQKCAYERGLRKEQVFRVLAIELRDKLLGIVGLRVP